MINSYKYKNNSYEENINIKTNIFMNRVYGWMSIGLFLTSLTSFFISKIPCILNLIFNSQLILLLMSFSQFFIVFYLSSMINCIENNLAIFLFILYSIITGINISGIFLIYTLSSIFTIFMITSLTFIIMTLYGYFTKNDLTDTGNLLLMLLIGTSLSSLFNICINSDILTWIISYISIFIFTGLIAFDTYKLKDISKKYNEIDNCSIIKNYSVIGALILYLDFINLFLIPLKISYNKYNKNKNNNKS
ncbi:uncharacterized protein NARSGI1_02020 [endosymbiont of Sipalinus gigas]|uniref:Bax inhibitor-1/YccA family protein n=1 Tax=endosymbiont of Sipalinus gigas TaxID=1972134 RepID=UPI000DC73D8F|nr:Bax inhibitor-1/YccA family protein [endosymbiont of Sipalinus gigas]BBA85339.1 uncharacterized protein NARSGI1_02020 [endosymbiont of Sipalinus gigas]